MFGTNFSGKAARKIQNVILNKSVVCYESLSDECYHCFAIRLHVFYDIKKILIKLVMKHKKENADRSTFPQMDCNSSHP